MFFAKIPRHTRQNAITEGDLECILTRNCEGTEPVTKIKNKKEHSLMSDKQKKAVKKKEVQTTLD